jgi:hypothetical protein
LVKVVEELGYEACGDSCEGIAVVPIPASVDFVVEKDSEMGSEWIAQRHRIWDRKDDPNFDIRRPTCNLMQEVVDLKSAITEYSCSIESKQEAQRDLVVIYKELLRRNAINPEDAKVPDIVIVERKVKPKTDESKGE